MSKMGNYVIGLVEDEMERDPTITQEQTLDRILHPENVFDNLTPERKFVHLTAGSQQELREEHEHLKQIAASWKMYLAIRLSGDPYAEEAEANFYMPEARAA